MELEKLPNIGPELAKRLRTAGIKSAQELRDMGASEAFVRLRMVDTESCLNSLYAIAGAIEGMRWHDLDHKLKLELKDFFDSLAD